MKIKVRILITVFGMSLLLSCQEWMDLIPPQGLIRQEYWKSKEDVEAVMMGAYDTFAKLDRLLFLYGELRGDMVIGDYQLGNSERQMSESTIYPENYLCNWGPFYEVINYCNEVIKNAPEVQEIDDTFSEFQMQEIMAEAVFLRSLSYFYLVRIWKDVPLVTEPVESDDVVDSLYRKQNTDVEVIDYILEDLENNRNLATIDGYQTLEEVKGRATRQSFDALMADINLWIFDYDEVIRHVENLEADFGKNNIELLYPGFFFELYYPGNSFESIFEIQFNKENSQQNSLYGLTRHDDHNIDPSEKAIEIFSFESETSAEKVRGEDTSIKKEGEDNYIIWKYVGRAPDGETERANTESTSANFIIYRLADVFLMKAEALAQKEMYNDAFLYMKNVMDMRDVSIPPLAETRAAYEDAIMDQRAKELAFEGKRWFDLMRMGRRNNFARKSKFIDIVIEDVPSAQKRILKTKLINPLGWYLPVYEYELERNKELEQNPYYNF
ncbi:MAG: RagB/SusD family nutrient uptake outer membrane protein [Bacteroidales bacterium]|nr:RagB/SusD family nutrient uptake outer membrane protein [Bacteroidales bacterium]